MRKGSRWPANWGVRRGKTPAKKDEIGVFWEKGTKTAKKIMKNY